MSYKDDGTILTLDLLVQRHLGLEEGLALPLRASDRSLSKASAKVKLRPVEFSEKGWVKALASYPNVMIRASLAISDMGRKSCSHSFLDPL